MHEYNAYKLTEIKKTYKHVVSNPQMQRQHVGTISWASDLRSRNHWHSWV